MTMGDQLLEQGRVEGRVQGLLEAASRMIADGMTAEQAARILGLDLETVLRRCQPSTAPR